MSCTVNYDVLKAYPEIVPAIFISSAQEGFNKTDSDINAYIADSAVGYLNELENLGQASVAPASRDNSASLNNPYSTYLRPVTDLKEILQSQKVFVEKLEFYAFDSTKDGSEHQNSELFDEVYASRNGTKTYNQSVMLNGMMNSPFVPNFFRPEVRINDIDILKGLGSTNFGNRKNKGDLSIGLPLPYCVDVYREFGKVSKIEAFAQYTQILPATVPSGYLYQRYPVQLIITFRCGTGSVNFKNG
jgi:hypothetical protein